MDFFNPKKRAETFRAGMLKNGKYLIAKIEGSGQAQKDKKVLNTYFRYKDYLDPKKNAGWFSASLEEIWSPRFLGLAENFWNKPIEKVKKLEFQNPAYSAAYKLGGDPRNYTKVFTIQLAGCDFDCNYCYVPKKINVANPCLGKFFSAKEIIDNFLSAKEKSEEPMNVIRITGGNPTIVPEIIVDVYNEMKKRGLNAYLWIDSNLSTKKYLENLECDLKKVLCQKNVGVVGCFKGSCKEDFALLTGAKPRYYKNQFETAKWFLEKGTDFYVYLPALIYENNVEGKLENFVEKLRKLDRNLPLRTEVLEIINYSGAKLNFERAKKIGRALPKTDQRTVFNIWYNKILPKSYPQKDLNKYCCKIPLQKHK